MFQTPSAGRWVLQLFLRRRAQQSGGRVSNPISGEVGAAAARRIAKRIIKQGGSFKPHQRGGGCCSRSCCPSHRGCPWFQTPSAGRWVLQPKSVARDIDPEALVSNPISGEVGAAARCMDKAGLPHSRFQTPSAGRWVLQLGRLTFSSGSAGSFKPHQRGGGCCSSRLGLPAPQPAAQVSNPISGEVGAAAQGRNRSRGRDHHRFKPHQRGGGCCSGGIPTIAFFTDSEFQTPSAGRWVLQQVRLRGADDRVLQFQTPSAGRWVLQHEYLASKFFKEIACFKPHQRGGGCCSEVEEEEAVHHHLVSNPISGEVGAAAPVPTGRTTRTGQGCFKPHQRGGGCCSLEG